MLKKIRDLISNLNLIHHWQNFRISYWRPFCSLKWLTIVEDGPNKIRWEWREFEWTWKRSNCYDRTTFLLTISKSLISLTKKRRRFIDNLHSNLFNSSLFHFFDDFYDFYAPLKNSASNKNVKTKFRKFRSWTSWANCWIPFWELGSLNIETWAWKNYLRNSFVYVAAKIFLIKHSQTWEFSPHKNSTDLRTRRLDIG